MTVRWDSRGTIAAVRRKAAQGVKDATELVEDVSVQKITSGPKTGIVYSRPGGVTHQASAAGEAPANDTGALLDSRLTEFADDGLIATFSYNTAYSRRLELGDEDFPARPYLNSSLEEHRDEVERLISSSIRGAL